MERDLPKFFGPATRSWFAATFRTPTRVQDEGWPAIMRREHVLLHAPTGRGKTLAAFLCCLDQLGRVGESAPTTRVVYISPLKALAYDVERNLRQPLAGIAREAQRLGIPFVAPTVAVRTGDTPPQLRRRQSREPAALLVTTPESLFLLLLSTFREKLRTVETIIVDEIHALAQTKRGAHLALSLERLTALTGRDPQRIGLSATQRPLTETARFLGGDRPVTIIDAAEPPRLELQVVTTRLIEPYSVEIAADSVGQPCDPTTPSIPAPAIPAPPNPPDPAALPGPPRPARGVWPAIYQRVLAEILAHRSTIVFVNSRGACERLAQQVNELAGTELVQAHHGSISRHQRQVIETQLKEGQLRGLVATSSLELGIDMGAVDLVLQLEAPGSVTQGLQRFGRAGHGVGQVSRGRILPKIRGDLVQSTVIAHELLAGRVESIRVPRNCLDVLAQQIVAVVTNHPITVEALHQLVRRSYSYATLTRETLHGVLELLTGRYPSDDFADLRPLLSWDRAQDLLQPRPPARLVAALNAGTIPDRGLYGVHLGATGPRIGELDEEMVFESRRGEVVQLGASSWRIEEITRDRVIVSAAVGEPGKLPFWHGTGPGRPPELGRAVGAFLRSYEAVPAAHARGWLQEYAPLDEATAANLAAYLDEQRALTGCLPTDQTLLIERFRDELGDWRICLHSPFGRLLHLPWALALEALSVRRTGIPLQTVVNDDGIAIRFVDGTPLPAPEQLFPDPGEVEQLVTDQLGRSALFAGRFRENAARALLLPRRQPGRRTPLWAQRLRSQTLLAVAQQHPTFPILLETYREWLQDLFDLPLLCELLRQVHGGEVRIVTVGTPRASPFASSLVFAAVTGHMYDGELPAAEQRAQALTLDRALLRELLGQEPEPLLEPDAIRTVEARLQALTEERRATHADLLHDLLRRLGDLSLRELQQRAACDVGPWLDQLRRQGRVARLSLAGEERWVVAEDVARYQAACGALLLAAPEGVPAAGGSEPADAEPLVSLLRRYARTHGPFLTEASASRLGLPPAVVGPALQLLAARQQLIRGRFGTDHPEERWCDPDVLRQLQRTTVEQLRQAAAPVDAATLGRFLPRWHGLGDAPRPGQAGELAEAERVALREAVTLLEGLPLPYFTLTRLVLPARVAGFTPERLDELSTGGELVWLGCRSTEGGRGQLLVCSREQVPFLLPRPVPDPGLSTRARELLDVLEQRGAMFQSELLAALGHPPLPEWRDALWELIWGGLVTNDSFSPLRELPSRAPVDRQPDPGRGIPRHGSAAGSLAAQYPPGPHRSWSGFSFPRGARPWSGPRVAAGGRWSPSARLFDRPSVTETERLLARTRLLLERYGLVARAMALGEELPGGFAALYPVLRGLEEAGQLRRGQFVAGLEGAQFALPIALEQLRQARPASAPSVAVTLAALDPANPYGLLLPWPATSPRERTEATAAVPRPLTPRRTPRGLVVLVEGVPTLFLELGGRTLITFAGRTSDELLRLATHSLRTFLLRTLRESVNIRLVDSVAPAQTPVTPSLIRAGFTMDYRGLTLSIPAGSSAVR